LMAASLGRTNALRMTPQQLKKLGITIVYTSSPKKTPQGARSASAVAEGGGGRRSRRMRRVRRHRMTHRRKHHATRRRKCRSGRNRNMKGGESDEKIAIKNILGITGAPDDYDPKKDKYEEYYKKLLEIHNIWSMGDNKTNLEIEFSRKTFGRTRGTGRTAVYNTLITDLKALDRMLTDLLSRLPSIPKLSIGNFIYEKNQNRSFAQNYGNFPPIRTEYVIVGGVRVTAIPDFTEQPSYSLR